MKRYLYTFLLSAFALTSCLREREEIVTVDIRLVIPEEYREYDVDLTQIDVKLQNKTLPFTFVSHPDREGNVRFETHPGKYDLLASAYFRESRIAINGSLPEFIVTRQGIVTDEGTGLQGPIDMELSVAVPNALIIRELYYHGSNTLEGGKYNKDTYFELYNNSGARNKTVYLDSLCVATLFPPNSTGSNGAWKGKDTLPIFQMFWMFPGDGTTYPLKAGESCVVAIRAAVDHGSRATSGLQLNRAHFGCYADHLPHHEIDASVTPLVCYMAGQGTGWGFSISSPAFVVFRPEMGVKAYRDHPEVWERFQPGATAGTRYWHISRQWIIDGVECFDKPESGRKRLPEQTDASYVWMRSPRYSGKCITRKLEFVENGIEVFMDTNNSEADFLPDSELNPRLKK